MKLIQCYVENFGTLHQYTYKFNDGMNTILETNGWGKTTLSVFLKAMFYGLANYSGGNLTENERRKYTPWQGENFGGYLDFETNHNTYRIERTFGKTPNKDMFKLINLTTGLPCKDFSKNIGEELFGIDADGFQRTLFVPQKTLLNVTNESITNKLTNLLHGTTADASYENADKLLDEQRSALSNRHRTGQIDCLQTAMQNKSIQIDTLQKSLSAMPKPPLNETPVDLNNQIQPTPFDFGFTPYLIAILVTCLCLMTGIIMCFVNVVVGSIILVIFSVLLVISIILAIKAKKKSKNQPKVDLNSIVNSRLQKANQIKQYNDDLDSFKTLCAEYDNLTERCNDLQKNLDAIVLAKDFLAKASSKINSKFLGPMQQNLHKYLQIFTKQEPNFILDTNLGLSFTENGQTRALDYYSRGYQNIFDLCLRFALIDALFVNEAPFIVMDDPFTNLDDERLKSAKEFIRSIADKHQIVYFTCHPSRS